jgi:hypothetical protein
MKDNIDRILAIEWLFSKCAERLQWHLGVISWVLESRSPCRQISLQQLEQLASVEAMMFGIERDYGGNLLVRISSSLHFSYVISRQASTKDR